jgi:hypothetical protein
VTGYDTYILLHDVVRKKMLRRSLPAHDSRASFKIQGPNRIAIRKIEISGANTPMMIVLNDPAWIAGAPAIGDGWLARASIPYDSPGGIECSPNMLTCLYRLCPRQVGNVMAILSV